MPIGLGTGETFDVTLGDKRIVFRHLSVRESRQYGKDLQAYLDRPASNDDDAAEAALALVQPFTTLQLADNLTTSEALVLPVAFQQQRQIQEAELGKSLWQRTFAGVSSATTASADATTGQPATPP